MVTTVLHMARSIALLKAKGMTPVPAPIGYQAKDALTIGPVSFFPSSKGIDKMERVVYEYLGISWAWFRGQICPQNLMTPKKKE